MSLITRNDLSIFGSRFSLLMVKIPPSPYGHLEAVLRGGKNKKEPAGIRKIPTAVKSDAFRVVEADPPGTGLELLPTDLKMANGRY